MSVVQSQVDILVVGGGMVGAAAASLLAQQGYSICVVEAHEPASYSPEQPMDLRVSAISPASVRLLKEAGAWNAIQSMRIKPYKELATWEIPGLETRFRAEEVDTSELGFIVENRLIQLALWEQLKANAAVTIRCPLSVTSLEQSDDSVLVSFSDSTQCQAKWVLAADGAHSKVKQLVGIGGNSFDYRQDCMLINVDLSDESEAITWQQFFPDGPRAFLPLAGNKASLVWYDRPERIAALMQLNLVQLTREVRQHFPPLLADFQISQRGSFPLTRRHAHHYYQGRVILLGDAAHTIHPLAGQGVNIGFKDVELLVALFKDAQPFDIAGLQTYQNKRMRDNWVMQSTMDLFYTGFRTTFFPVKVLRNVGLLAAEHSGWIKQKALRYALGLS